jgi:hypothetical protein
MASTLRNTIKFLQRERLISVPYHSFRRRTVNKNNQEQPPERMFIYLLIRACEIHSK